MATYRPAIASMSLGRAWVHDFDNKLQQAAEYGFEGIEIFYEDLEYLAKELAKTTEPPSPDQILTAAKHIRNLSDTLNLTIIGLQPFLFYDGLLDREEQKRLATTKIQLWFQIAHTLNTTTIQIPANFLSANKLTSSEETISNDLRELADLGLQQKPIIRFAYEQLCWSTHIDTWEKGWSIVQKVNRPNFGLCLDTFNIAGRIWGDPSTKSGKTSETADEDLKISLQRMISTIDVTKIFYIQVVDAEKMRSPLVKGHPFYEPDQPARMSWSRNARTFIYENETRGAYLPVEEVARVIIKEIGYKGFISMELFSRTLAVDGKDVPGEHARRGIEAWRKLVERLDLN